MNEVLVLLLGTFYGLIIGLIPAAGATTGLITLFSFMYLFSDPYLGVIFCMAVVAASTTGDTFAGILLGIPGANSAAATMVDGFPLALKGKATYAISAAVTSSTINGLLWGSLVFLFIPFYMELLLFFGVPELWAFTIFALATVGFISSKWMIRSTIAIILGIFFGLVGVDPNTNEARFTLGWFYLQDGIQLMPVVAGLFAIPELLEGFKKRDKTSLMGSNHLIQLIDGIKVVFKNIWLSLRGGFIGAFIGVLPGLGGAVADWIAYGQSGSKGNGDIRGVIGPEGANNAQKATSMLPTILFGIPGAPFAAIIMALFTYLGFELGTPDLAYDTLFFDSLTFGFIAATALTGVICLVFAQYFAYLSYVPYRYYFPIVLLFIVWACMQYTGGWEDLIMLLFFSAVGIICKYVKFSRPSLLIGFILSERVEALSIQMFTLYDWSSLMERPIFLGLILATVIVGLIGLFKRNRLEYV